MKSDVVSNVAADSSHVLHVFNRMDPGGAELRTSELVNQTGLVFDFLCIAGGDGLLDDELRSRGHNVFNMRLSLRSLREYYRLMRNGDYRAVHSHLGAASGLIVVLALIARVPRRIVHFRSDGVGGGSRLAKTLYIFASRILIQLFSTHILGVSPGSLEHGWKSKWRMDDRCRVIPNGYDSSVLRDCAPTHLDVGPNAVMKMVNVGRVLPEKNRVRAIEIWREATKVFPVDLALVGNMSPSEEELCRSVRSQIVGPSKITLHGFTTKAVEEIGRSDVLIVTSMREGLPGVVLEALAMGVPVVSSDLPGSRWIADHVIGVTICKLSDGNAAWISAIRSSSSIRRDEVRASFDESPFNQKKVVPQFMEVWGLDGTR